MSSIRPLILAHSLNGFAIHASDGALGRITDFYFNDETWKIHNVVVDLGHWLPGRKVLILPHLLGHADWRKRFIEARTTKEQIRSSPDIESALPVALQIEREKNRYLMANEPFVPEAWLGMHQYVEPVPNERNDDQHLRSTMILGFCSVLSDGNKVIGSILDFLIDTETWEIRFLLLKTNDHRVFLTQPGIVQSIDVSNRTILIVHPDDVNKEWQEYDPHYMALLETGRE